ncbi:replication initiator protein [Dipodfec virus UOA04_Rod_1058]|nr:replication initiator protein [Dipodfec virus UOA04_Rod_1058]
MKCLKPIPLYVDLPDEDGVVTLRRINVPCGHCEACYHNRSLEWQVRIMEEVRDSEKCCFFTLTYDDDHLPMSYGSDYNGPNVLFANFSYSDIKGFVKRLRDRIKPFKIKFFITPEFGPNTLRPHYHGIIFNHPFRLDKFDEILNDCWKKGFTSVSPITPARIPYVAKYVNSFSCLPSWYPRPRIIASRRPAVGIGYLSRLDRIKWHKENLINYYVSDDGYKYPLPRYYARKIFSPEELLMLRLQAEEYNEIESEREKQLRACLTWSKDLERCSEALDELHYYIGEDLKKVRQFKKNFYKKTKKRKDI